MLLEAKVFHIHSLKNDGKGDRNLLKEPGCVAPAFQVHPGSIYIGE